MTVGINVSSSVFEKTVYRVTSRAKPILDSLYRNTKDLITDCFQSGALWRKYVSLKIGNLVFWYQVITAN